MNRLFIEINVDEDVNVLVATLLRAHGFVALPTEVAAQRGNTDAEQVAYAVSQGMAILTHNRGDFEALAREYAATGQAHFGIIIAVRRPTHELMRRLLLILNHVTADEMRNQLRYI